MIEKLIDLVDDVSLLTTPELAAKIDELVDWVNARCDDVPTSFGEHRSECAVYKHAGDSHRWCDCGLAEAISGKAEQDEAQHALRSPGRDFRRSRDD